MKDESDEGHVLTLHESIQRSISSLQQVSIIDSNLQLIDHINTLTTANFKDASTTTTGFSTLAQLFERNRDIVLDAIHFANNIKNIRQSTLKEFHERVQSINDVSSKCIDDVVIISSAQSNVVGTNNLPVSTTSTSSSLSPSHTSVDSNVKYLTQLQFKRNYLYTNKPCIIHNLNEQDFKAVSMDWVKRNNANQTTSQPCVNSDWFLNEIGSSTMVPVRKMPNSNHNDAGGDLDEDGRAVECETVEMTMKDWIDILSRQNIESNDNIITSSNVDSTLYLKDWHLQKIFEDKRMTLVHQMNSMQNETSYTTTNFHQELYTVPRIFAGDVINPFLLANGGGDYRFVYWGPKGSSTSIHFDVLHTFSWSFNVVGEKEWKFYLPKLQSDGISYMNEVSKEPKDSDQSDTNKKTFKIFQKTGETIFVPSRWIHSVQNVRETLSINQNWITPSTLDEMYGCIISEIRAIDKELSDWGVSLNDDDENEEVYDHSNKDFGNLESFRIRENMLRGCVGMDVTSFCTMLMGCLSDCFMKLCKISGDMMIFNDSSDLRESLWEHWFDFTCTANVLYFVLLDKKGQQRSHVQKRLCAMLGKQIGMKVNDLMKNLVISCNALILGIAGCRLQVRVGISH